VAAVGAVVAHAGAAVALEFVSAAPLLAALTYVAVAPRAVPSATP